MKTYVFENGTIRHGRTRRARRADSSFVLWIAGDKVGVYKRHRDAVRAFRSYYFPCSGLLASIETIHGDTVTILVEPVIRNYENRPGRYFDGTRQLVF